MTYGGRTRIEIERDVLASMILVGPFRERALPRLSPLTFTTSEHRRLYDAIRRPRNDLSDPEAFIARTLGVTLEGAKWWLLDSLPTTYDADLERLLLDA